MVGYTPVGHLRRRHRAVGPAVLWHRHIHMLALNIHILALNIRITDLNIRITALNIHWLSAHLRYGHEGLDEDAHVALGAQHGVALHLQRRDGVRPALHPMVLNHLRAEEVLDAHGDGVLDPGREELARDADDGVCAQPREVVQRAAQLALVRHEVLTHGQVPLRADHHVGGGRARRPLHNDGAEGGGRVAVHHHDHVRVQRQLVRGNHRRRVPQVDLQDVVLGEAALRPLAQHRHTRLVELHTTVVRVHHARAVRAVVVAEDVFPLDRDLRRRVRHYPLLGTNSDEQ
eukprot:6022998-Pyramimonas_sp.AAC.1